MGITEKSRLGQLRRNWNSRLRAWQTDRRNRTLYGEDAPKFAERLWVPLAELEYIAKIGSSKDSGQVVDSWPEGQPEHLDRAISIRACVDHWRDGIPWEKTGIYDVMMDEIQRNGKVDRLRTLDDVKTRYAQLDELFQEIRATGRLSTREELIPGNFREEGGILINIGPDGRPYFGRKGNHRLAMAIAAGLDYVPAQLGIIHIDSLPMLGHYRNPPIHQATQ